MAVLSSESPQSPCPLKVAFFAICTSGAIETLCRLQAASWQAASARLALGAGCRGQIEALEVAVKAVLAQGTQISDTPLFPSN
jgi:hypothetical protein